MPKPFTLLLPALGAGALLMAAATTAPAATAPAPSPALSTTITSGGKPYSGDVKATNINGTRLSGNGPGVGLITTTCTSATLVAAVVSDGTSGSLKDLALSGCTNNFGGSDTITVGNLPYTGGSVVHDPVSGGRDGVLKINAPNPGVDVKAVLNLKSLGRTETCHYGLTGSAPLTIDLFNGNNPARPDTANAHSQGELKGQSLQKVASSENTSGCPASASANGRYQLLTSPGGADLLLGP
ncbi:hypothetical protein AGRA3207_005622 [Actinomadura graeca]|uniref:Secreted protein n=1 Tax=Actinomadura graeca TaxID=2750812 RepID=A0ABX8R2Y1_9ACTN|nr:hypothetical protein [Actinomadura graeca]QXJ24322.1 hypothetical protein AGRA3207_005622 [Actinomadura graeca]